MHAQWSSKRSEWGTRANSGHPARSRLLVASQSTWCPSSQLCWDGNPWRGNPRMFSQQRSSVAAFLGWMEAVDIFSAFAFRWWMGYELFKVATNIITSVAFHQPVCTFILLVFLWQGLCFWDLNLQLYFTVPQVLCLCFSIIWVSFQAIFSRSVNEWYVVQVLLIWKYLSCFLTQWSESAGNKTSHL